MYSAKETAIWAAISFINTPMRKLEARLLNFALSDFEVIVSAKCQQYRYVKKSPIQSIHAAFLHARSISAHDKAFI